MPTGLTAAALAAVILGEPIGINIIVGIAAVLTGIWIASTDGRRHSELTDDVTVAYQADYWNDWRPGYRASRSDDDRS